MKKEKVIVTGGSGFLGSHLADVLMDDGYEVTIFDCHKSKWIKNGQKFICGNILNKEDVDKAINGFDYVYHLAGISDIGEASSNPLKTIETNIMGSINVIESSKTAKIKRFIFASTVYVYSEKGSFYRASKQAVESIIEEYNKKFGLKYTILRYGSLYGKRSQDWNALKKFVIQAIKDGRIIYPGNGKERREYIHVEDAAKLSVEILKPEFINQYLTITGTQIFSPKETMNMIVEIIGKDIQIDFSSDNSDYDISHYKLTPYKYTPKQGKKMVPIVFVDLGQGILDLVEEISKKNK